jgi:hypothetical protein
VSGEQASRRAAALVGTYHEARLADLIEHVREGLARYDSGEIDAFELDDLIHRYKRAARELWKFCSVSGGHVVRLAAAPQDDAANGTLPDWWELAKPRERRLQGRNLTANKPRGVTMRRVTAFVCPSGRGSSRRPACLLAVHCAPAPRGAIQPGGVKGPTSGRRIRPGEAEGQPDA